MFICEMRQTWILVVIFILFVMGITTMFSLLGYMIFMIWICNKCFSFHHFHNNQSSSVKWDKLGLLELSLFFLLWALQSCFPHWYTRSWCFGFVRKAFPSTIFCIINVHPWNETIRFARKAFLSTIFFVINVHLWNETSLDTHNNHHSFCYWHCDHVLHIAIHNLDALDL